MMSQQEERAPGELKNENTKTPLTSIFLFLKQLSNRTKSLGVFTKQLHICIIMYICADIIFIDAQ